MSSIGKLRKNAENYRINEIYRSMTPEQYREGIRIAVKNATETLTTEYDAKLQKIANESNTHIQAGMRMAIDTISVELLYELANQLECFVSEPQFLEDKIKRVQEIYENTMKAIENYTIYTKTGKARKEFEAKKKKLEKMFNIEF